VRRVSGFSILSIDLSDASQKGKFPRGSLSGSCGTAFPLRKPTLYPTLPPGITIQITWMLVWMPAGWVSVVSDQNPDSNQGPTKILLTYFLTQGVLILNESWRIASHNLPQKGDQIQMKQRTLRTLSRDSKLNVIRVSQRRLNRGPRIVVPAAAHRRINYYSLVLKRAFCALNISAQFITRKLV
jgi:hypothetical protein